MEHHSLINSLSWELDRYVMFRRVLINREADENGVYLGQHHVLGYIKRHPGCSQKEIAAALSQSAAAVTLSTKRLQEMGLITKRTDADNLRMNHLFITEKGEENERSFLSVIDRYNDMAMQGFSDEEKQQLRSFVARMHQNLQQSGSAAPRPEEVFRENKKIVNCGKKGKTGNE